MKANIKGFNSPLPVSELEKDKLLKTRFTEKSISIANAFGFVPLLHSLAEIEIKIKKDPSIINQNEYANIQNKINQMVSLSIMEVSSTVTELHCFENRIKEIVNTVRNKETETNRNYTALSIVVTATLALVSGIVQWQSNTIQAVVSVVGGISIGAISYKSINIETQIQYYSVKKVLKEFWYKPAKSENFSPPIWFLLNQSSKRSKVKDSLRDILVERWKENGYLGNDTVERKKMIQLYFDESGTYTTDQLEKRKDMLIEIATEINLLQQDIRSLIDELY